MIGEGRFDKDNDSVDFELLETDAQLADHEQHITNLQQAA